MPRKVKRRAISVDARLRKIRQLRKEKQLALMKDLRLFPTKHRVLLPRPEVVLLAMKPEPPVITPSSSTSNESNVVTASSDEKVTPLKKVYLVGPNSVLYEAVVAQVPHAVGPTVVGPTTPVKLPPPNISPAIPIESSALESSRGTPVEEIQVKVEASDYKCYEKLPNESDEENTSVTKTLALDQSIGKETMSGNSPPSIKKDILTDDDEGETTDIVKEENIKFYEELLDSPFNYEGTSSNSTSNEQEIIPKPSLFYPRKVPLRSGKTNSDDSIYCDECDEDYAGDCPEHGPLIIVDDTPVTANINDDLRAKKTAPAVVYVADSGIAGVGSGVWARQVIPVRTRFGPFDGKMISAGARSPFTWLIRLDGKPGFCIDASEPGLSNWMRYVASARRIGEPNLRPFQRFGKLFFRTTRQIEPHEELLLDDYTIANLNGDLESRLKQEQDLEESAVEMQLNSPSNMSSPMFVESYQTIKCERELFVTEGDELIESDSEDSRMETSSVDVPALVDKASANYSEENLFSCTLCKARFRFEETLHNHLKTHSADNQLACKVCSEHFFDVVSLKKHLQVHKHGDVAEALTAELCETVGGADGSREYRYVCNLCKTRFLYEGSLKHHMQTHIVDNQLQCNQCKERFFDHRTFMKHLQVHKDTTVSCPVCNAKFRFQASLNKHLAIAHQSEKPFACPLCDERFKESATLEYHQKLHTVSKHYCNVCHKSFLNNILFKEHHVSHLEDNMFMCGICDERFPNAPRLKDHLRMHKGLKMTECTLCDMKFASQSQFKKHVKAHSSNNACSCCDERFASESDLLEHRKTHRDTLMKCKMCNATFSRRQYYARHVALHKQPLECTVCKERFDAMRLLRTHIRTHHSESTGLQTWKSWEAWKSQETQNQSSTQKVLRTRSIILSDRLS